MEAEARAILAEAVASPVERGLVDIMRTTYSSTLPGSTGMARVWG